MPRAGEAAVAGRLRRQADWCDDDRERLYAELLRQAAEDVEAGGPAWDLLGRRPGRWRRRAPLVWLWMEPGTAAFEVRLTAWPGGLDRLVATSGSHGRDVRRSG